MITACAPLYRCGFNDSPCSSPKILNSRFEYEGQGLNPNQALWLRSGDQLFTRWDTYSFNIQLSDVECDFANLGEGNGDCQICDFCQSGEPFERLCPNGTAHLDDLGEFRVVFFEAFNSNTEPTPVSSMNPVTGCAARGLSPVPFTPGSNGAYQAQYLGVVQETFQYLPLFDQKIFVIQSNMPQPSTSPLTRYAEQYDPSTLALTNVWYRWTAGPINSWENNFSQNLRISGIRVLAGTPVIGSNTCQLGVEDVREVRPSRILFLPNFSAIDTTNSLSDGDDILTATDVGTNRCYAIPNTTNGEINLTQCLQNPGDTTRQSFQFTPTSRVPENGDPLTWFVEFTAANSVPVGTCLAIEFTIEALP